MGKTDELRQRCAAFLLPAFASSRVAPLIGETGSGGFSVDLAHDHHGTRFTLRYRFPSGKVVYAKSYRSQGGRRLFGTLCALWKSGFNDTSRFRVPEPLGFLEEENVVLMAEARGFDLSSQLAELPLETGIVRVRAAARWLLALHSAQLSGPDQEGPCKRAKIFKESPILAQAAAAHPEHASALLEFLDNVKQLAWASAAEPTLRTTHGQFQPRAVFVDSDSDTVTAIDLDTVSVSDPAKDVARFISTVCYREVLRPGGEPTRTARLASEFADEYARSAGGNLANLPYYLALYSLKEFAKFLLAPDVDRSSRDRAERLCRAELERYVSQGAPKRRRATERPAANPRADIMAAWPALCSAQGRFGAGAREPNVTVARDDAAERDGHTSRLTLRLTAPSEPCLYAKWYPYDDERRSRCSKVTAALWEFGFGRDAPCRVHEIAALVPDRSVIFLHAVEGVPLSSLLKSGALSKAVKGSRAAARWLLALHRSPVRVGSPEGDLHSLRAFRIPERLIMACARFPDLTDLLVEIMHRLEHRVKTLAAASVVQTHGSYRATHVFVADGVTTVIDLDGSLPSDPAKDVAEFVSHVQSAACHGRYDRHVARRAVDAFLDEYFSQAPELETRVACYSACYLTLRLLHRIKEGGVADPRWPEQLESYREAFGSFFGSTGGET